MNAISSSIMFDVAVAVQRERIERAAKERQIREAAGQRGQFQIVAAIRRAFGGALIAVGQSVHGERAEAIDNATVPSAGTLRLAR